MNTLQKTLIALATGSLLSVSAQAAISYGNGATAQPYLGAKIGQYNVDADDAEDAMSYGVYGGLKFTPNFGLEAEYLTTNDADIDDAKINNQLIKSEYSGNTYGLYGTYDYAFPNAGGLYAKGRLGFAKNEIKTEVTNTVTKQTASPSFSDTGIAGGIGLGYNITPQASVEAMYNIYPSVEVGNDDFDVTGLTLGAHFKF